MEFEGVSRTTTAAVKLCKAVPAFFLGIYIAYPEFFPDFRFIYSFEYITHQKFGNSHELVAGIQISPRSHSQVLGTGTAAGQTFCHAGPTCQIYHEMEEVELLPFFLAFQH